MEDEGMGGRTVKKKTRQGVIPCLICFFLSLIPSNCEWFDIKKKKPEIRSVCGLSRN